MNLIAKSRILCGNYIYEPGDKLPTTDTAYCADLVAAGSASWEDDEDVRLPERKAKAKPLTAPAGVTGYAQPATSAEPDLVGRVPSAKARGAAPEPRKKGKKSPK